MKNQNIPLAPGEETEKESVTQAPRLLKAPAPTAAKPINVVTVTKDKKIENFIFGKEKKHKIPGSLSTKVSKSNLNWQTSLWL